MAACGVHREWQGRATPGATVERHLLVNARECRNSSSLTMSNAAPRHCENSSWVRNDIWSVIERGHPRRNRARGSIAGLYRGENLGKRLIRIAPDVLAS